MKKINLCILYFIFLSFQFYISRAMDANAELILQAKNFKKRKQLSPQQKCRLIKNTQKQTTVQPDIKKHKKNFAKESSTSPFSFPYRLFDEQELAHLPLSYSPIDCCLLIKFIEEHITVKTNLIAIPPNMLCPHTHKTCQYLTQKQQKYIKKLLDTLKETFLLSNSQSDNLIKLIIQCCNHGLQFTEGNLNLLIWSGKNKIANLFELITSYGTLVGIINFPLPWAILWQHEEVISQLVNTNLQKVPFNSLLTFNLHNNFSPLMLAVLTENLNILNLILENCLQGKSDDQLSPHSTKTICPLILAIAYQSIEKNSFFHEEMINYQGFKGRTAFMLAAKIGSTAIVEHLFYQNAKINLSDFYGCTAFWLACKEGHKDVVEKLLHFNALPNIENNRSTTSLMIACEYGHLNIVILLLNLNNCSLMQKKDYKGNTAFMIACKNGYLSIVKEFINRHKNLFDNVNNQGKNALNLAHKNGHINVVVALLGSLSSFY